MVPQAKNTSSSPNNEGFSTIFLGWEKLLGSIKWPRSGNFGTFFFSKNHSSRENKNETTQPSHSPLSTVKTNRKYTYFQCIVPIGPIFASSFRNLDHVPFSEFFPGNKLPSPTDSMRNNKTLWVGNFWMIIMQNKGEKISKNIFMGFVVLKEEGGGGFHNFQTGMDFFLTHFFNYELPKKSRGGGSARIGEWFLRNLLFAAATNRSKITKFANWKMHGRTQQKNRIPCRMGGFGWVVLSSPDTLCDA